MPKKNPPKIELSLARNKLPLKPGEKIPVKITIRAVLELDPSPRKPDGKR